MNRKLSALLCCALALTLVGCQEEAVEPVLDPTVTVETTAAQVGDLSTQSTYIGTISAEGTASVVALVSGNVEELYVEVGDTVSPNDVLCRIDDESARLTLQSAQAAVSSAQAGYQSAQESYNSAVASYGGADLPVLQEQLRMAQNNYENTQALLEIGAASQLEVDQAYQALLSAQAGVEAAQANLNTAQAGLSTAQAGIQSALVGVESAQYQLSLYNITSPISGVVEAVNVTENNFTPSGTAAFVISNGSNKTVTFYVTDQVRQTLTLGQPVSVNYGGNSYTGAVTEISGVVDAQVGQFQVKAVINGAQDLPDGLSVELTTVAYRQTGAILIPSDAMFFEDGQAYVYLARNGAAVRTDVTIGLYTTDQIAVISGLKLGDEVITTWSASLRDGAAIRLAGETAEMPAGDSSAPQEDTSQPAEQEAED